MGKNTSKKLLLVYISMCTFTHVHTLSYVKLIFITHVQINYNTSTYTCTSIRQQTIVYQVHVNISDLNHHNY